MITTTMTGALPLLGTTSIGSNLMPLVIVALLIDAFIVAVWYMAGALMNNKTIKASAKGEFYQLLGTIVLAAIIVGVLLLFANMYMNIVGQPGTGLDPPQLNMYCGFLATPQPDPTSSLTLTSGLLNLGGSLGDNICGSGGILQGVSSSGATATQKIDYPLAATGIIIANLTSQAMYNFNQVYLIDSYLGFLTNFYITLALCIQTPDTTACLPVAGAASGQRLFNIRAEWNTYAPLEIIYRGLGSLTALLSLSIAAFLIQSIFIDLFIYGWPAILFIGLILRATPFTRRLGGLLIAVAIGAVLIFPTAFAIEFLSANSASSYTTCQSFANGNYSYPLSFFSMPNAYLIGAENNCYPWFGLAGTELADIIEAHFPLITIISDLGQIIWGIVCHFFSSIPGCSGSSLPGSLVIPELQVYPSCNLQNGQQTLFDLTQAYGTIGVTAYFLPILNILLTISFIIGMSGLLGGDTGLAGLSRLV